jgi:hypothetical protein
MSRTLCTLSKTVPTGAKLPRDEDNSKGSG